MSTTILLNGVWINGIDSNGTFLTIPFLKSADEIQAKEKRRADEIEVQMAKIEAEKELDFKEMELQARAQAKATTSPGATPPPCTKDAKSPKLQPL